jgi:hypothetical protein
MAVILGGIIEGYGAEFFAGVHFSPLTLGLGVVSHTATYNLRIHNRFLVPITLTGITPTGADGLTLGFAVGLTFARTQERIVTVTVEGAGDEAINASFLLTFDVGGVPHSVTLFVTGTRTQVWDSPIDWGDRFVAAYAYKTDMFIPRSGREQRRALRHNPRITLEFSNLVRRDDVRKFESLMAAKQNQATLAVDPCDSEVTSLAAVSGSDQLTFASLPQWAVVGTLVALPASLSMATYQIVGVGIDSITTLPALQQAYPAGTPVSVIHRGYLAAEIPARQPTSAVLAVSVRFDALPATAPRAALPEPDVTHNGLEVFLTRPNWGEAPDTGYEWPNESVDYGRGPIEVVNIINFPTRATTWNFTCKNRTAARKMRNFFDRVYGMRGEFYVPTWKRDLDPASSMASGAAFFKARGEGYAQNWSGSLVFKRIIIMLVDGTHLIRTVTSLVEDGLGDTTVSLDANFPATIAPDQVIMVSWLQRSRLASDILTLTWLTDSVATTNLAMRSLEDID